MYVFIGDTTGTDSVLILLVLGILGDVRFAGPAGLSEEEADENSIVSGRFADTIAWIEHVRNCKPDFATDLRQSRIDYSDSKRHHHPRELLHGFFLQESQRSIAGFQQLDVRLLSRHVRDTGPSRI